MQEIGSARKLNCLLSKSYPLSPRFRVKYGPREDSFQDGLWLLMRSPSYHTIIQPQISWNMAKTCNAESAGSELACWYQCCRLFLSALCFSISSTP